MKKVVLIYNPFSGRRKRLNLPELVSRYMDHSLFDVEVWPTEKADDVVLLTEKAIAAGTDIVLGAGGDGTINQIASRLVNTGIALGIIPLGSGNGFARHFGIPMDTVKAIRSIAECRVREIDTVWVNGHCVINIGGLGFDAHISAAFAHTKKRGLQGYIRTIARNLNYKCRAYKIYRNKELVWEGSAFLIGIANATQWGNNVVLHPGARPDDGVFNLLVLKQFSAADFLIVLKNLLEGKLHTDRNSLVFTGTDFIIQRTEDGPVHADGEPLWLGREININIEPLSLKILSHE